jgi:hypothetical protein
MADMLTWVASDAHRDAAGMRRQVVTELADDSGEPWNRDNLFRWGPAFGAPPEEDDEDADDYDEDDFDLGEEASSPDISSTTSTSAPARNRRMRRKAAAKGRKR